MYGKTLINPVVSVFVLQDELYSLHVVSAVLTRKFVQKFQNRWILFVTILLQRAMLVSVTAFPVRKLSKLLGISACSYLSFF